MEEPERYYDWMLWALRQEKYKGHTLHAFGDSFTYGYELSDCPTNDDSKKHSMLTYSALFSKHYNMKYKCHAIGGSANNGILRQIKLANIKEEDTCLVMWSYPIRYGIMLNEGWYTLDTEHKEYRWWWDNVDQDPEQCFDRTQDSILSAQAILDKIGCKYIFLFNNIELQNKIQYNNRYVHKHRCLFLPKDHKMINAKDSHPGEVVHESVFNILKEAI